MGIPHHSPLTEDRVDLSAFSPACLPGIGESFFNKKGHVYGEQHLCIKDFHPIIISGWGDTGVQYTSTDELKETIIPIVESSLCVENQPDSEDENLILCAGGEGKGPCKVSHQGLSCNLILN